MNRPDTDHRDRQLGLALRELEVPEHREAFFEELERRLSEHEPERRRPGLLRTPPRRALVLAGAACLAAVLVVTIGWPRLQGETGVASAARIVARLSNTVAEARTVRGRLVYHALDVRSGETLVTRQSFAEDARGDLRLTDRVGDLAYTASNGTERAVTTSASLGTGRFLAERTGLAPGPPDPGPTSSILDRELGGVVRGLAAAHDPRVENVSFDGRPAWRLSTAVRPNTIFPDADHLDVIVDRRSGFPVRVLTTLRGAFRSELVVRDLVLNGPVSARELRFPAHAEVLRTNEGFLRVGAPGTAGRIAGYRPLVPRDVPAGFRLTTVAVARSAAPTGPGESNPPSRDVISLSYRRGLDQFVVTTRLRGDGAWRDPFATEGVLLAGRPVDIGGALGRASTELVMDPRAVPHLWAITDRLVVTVSGDLDRPQLLSVARSLR